MTSLSPSTIMVLVFVPLIIWRVYSRIRRMVGRQRLSKIRPWITLTVFPLIVAMLALAGLRHPERLTLLAGGLAVGMLLAVHGDDSVAQDRPQLVAVDLLRDRGARVTDKVGDL